MPNVSGGSVVWDLNVDKSNFSAGLSDARSEMDKTAKDIDRSASSIASSIKSAFKEATNASFAFAAALTGIGVAGIGAVGFGVKMAADLETARQGFVTLLGSAEAADAAIAQIKKDAASTPFEFQGLVRANQMLTQVTKDAPRSEALLLNVGKALAAAGKGGAELDNVIVNLQQIANTSKISELDIRQFGFAGINVMELLADHYGTTKEEAVEMVKKSKNAFGDLEAAFAKAGEPAKTFSQLVAESSGDTIESLSKIVPEFDNLQKAFDKSGGSYKDFVDELGKSMDSTGPQALAFYKKMGIEIDDLSTIFKSAQSSGGKFSRAFIEQAGTFNQLMSNFGDIVSQTAAEVVTQTGMFDAVKAGLGGIIETLINFQPQIIQGIKDFMAFMAANGPIVVGVIAGGLTPAFVALAASVGASVIALAPFLVVGGALGLVIQKIVEQLGGWKAIQDQLNSSLTGMGEMFNVLFKPALDSLWQTIQTNLLPPLQELWKTAGPILTPILEFLAKLMGAALYGAFILIIEVLKVLVTWVGFALTKFTDFLNFLKGIPGAVKEAFSGLKDAITKPFEDAWNKIQEIAEKIKSKMQEISPFHRNSPSVVDLVTSGVGVIKDQFASLSDIKFPNFGHEMADGGGFMTAGFEQTREPQTNNNNGGAITVNIGSVNERSDVDMINRELGFRIGTMPAT